ncbi:hypothetical protein D3C78_1771700 [compost metagenome]
MALAVNSRKQESMMARLNSASCRRGMMVGSVMQYEMVTSQPLMLMSTFSAWLRVTI